MAEVSEAGRRALSDMRAMLGVLRTDDPPAGLAPQPGVNQLGALVERVRATGLAVDLDIGDDPFPLGAAAELTVYRIVQEALTNTIRHAGARRAAVSIRYDAPRVEVLVADEGTGTGTGPAPGPRHRGHVRACRAARRRGQRRPRPSGRLARLGRPAP
jgi:signal transduction histidine kinase